METSTPEKLPDPRPHAAPPPGMQASKPPEAAAAGSGSGSVSAAAVPDESSARPAPPGPRAGPLAVAGAVFWSFFGIRRKKDHAVDVQSLTLPQIIVGGILGAAVLVASLLALVIFVTRS